MHSDSNLIKQTLAVVRVSVQAFALQAVKDEAMTACCCVTLTASTAAYESIDDCYLPTNILDVFAVDGIAGQSLCFAQASLLPCLVDGSALK